MIAEYERAQIIERTRRGKTHRARQGTVNVLSGAPFGYRYVRKNEHADARYDVVAHEAAIVAELFRRYVEDGVAIADLARWLTATGVPTRTGKSRWDRSVVWGMLRNPAYPGGPASARPSAPLTGPASTAPPGWPAAPPRSPTRSRTATAPTGWRSPSRRWCPRTPGSGPSGGWRTTNASLPATPRSRPCCRAWPPARAADTPTTAGTRPPPRATRSTTTGVSARTTTATSTAVSATTPRSAPTTSTRSCGITSPACSPTRELIRSEIDRRLDQLRTADPNTSQQQRLEQALAKATASITRLIKAYQEELISLDELRERTPELRCPRDQPAQPTRRVGRPARRPRCLPQTRRGPGRLPRPAPRQRRHRHRRRAAARAAPARQRRPHRPRTHPHPPLHPDRRQQHLPDHKDHRR